jgi:hypothetical protein
MIYNGEMSRIVQLRVGLLGAEKVDRVLDGERT